MVDSYSIELGFSDTAFKLFIVKRQIDYFVTQRIGTFKKKSDLCKINRILISRFLNFKKGLFYNNSFRYYSISRFKVEQIQT